MLGWNNIAANNIANNIAAKKFLCFLELVPFWRVKMSKSILGCRGPVHVEGIGHRITAPPCLLVEDKFSSSRKGVGKSRNLVLDL